MPPLAQRTVLWQDEKSETTNPPKPQSSLSTPWVSACCSQENESLTWFLAHITEPAWPCFTAASNAGR